MKRSGPLKRGGPLARTRLRRQSAERWAENAEEYRDAVMVVNARDRGFCTAAHLVSWLPCAGRTDPHHILPTGQGGPRCDPDNIRLVCRAHHDWIHGHTNDARPLGLLR